MIQWYSSIESSSFRREWSGVACELVVYGQLGQRMACAEGVGGDDRLVEGFDYRAGDHDIDAIILVGHLKPHHLPVIVDLEWPDSLAEEKRKVSWPRRIAVAEQRIHLDEHQP